MLKIFKNWIFYKFEPIAFYFEIQRPVTKIIKALMLTGYTPEQAEDMAIKIVWNSPSTVLNAITYAEKNLEKFCDEWI